MARARNRTNKYSRKLHPWLRMVQNGDRDVNALRADGSTRVACTAQVGPDGLDTAVELQQGLEQNAAYLPTIDMASPAPPVFRAGPRPKMSTRNGANDSYVNVLVEVYPEFAADGVDALKARLESAVDAPQGAVARELIARRNLVCATVPVTDLKKLQRDAAVAFVHPFEPLALDKPVTRHATGRTAPRSKAIGSAASNGRGEDVLIGIIDVGGFDFAHPDFLRNGKTRFISIWDQGGDFRPPPDGFSRGSELVADDLNAAIAAAKKPGMPPATWIERQSQLQPGSHGTHVASIAAGNSGVCPGAKIAAVLLDVPKIDDDMERRRSTFSDTSSIIHAVEYLLKIAQREKLPISINISLGTNGGSHDGAGAVSRWLDAYLTDPGRAICVAAGNAGQEKSTAADDIGWVTGRIHTSGRIPARGLEVEIEWSVIGNGIEDVSENELEIWYGAQDRFSVSLKPPGSSDWIEVRPLQEMPNEPGPGGVHISIFNDLYHPTNGGNYISIYLSPNLKPKNFRGIPSGVWRVRLRGEEVRDGSFDAWIERDDPMEVGVDGNRRFFRFPSFFSEKSNVDSHSITSLACGHNVIAVANLDAQHDRIAITSSQGPTRDGRFKPEIAAPGTEILAANGFGGPDEPWISMSGTSMASPYVTGVLGLMLAKNPDLTAAQCRGILQRTARPLAGATYNWVNDVGFGKIDPKAAIAEAKLINDRVELR